MKCQDRMESGPESKVMIMIHGVIFDIETIKRIIYEYENMHCGLGLKIMYRTDSGGYHCLTGYFDKEGKRIVPYSEYSCWESYERDMLKAFHIPCILLERNGNLSSSQMQAVNFVSLKNGFGICLVNEIFDSGSSAQYLRRKER